MQVLPSSASTVFFPGFFAADPVEALLNYPVIDEDVNEPNEEPAEFQSQTDSITALRGQQPSEPSGIALYIEEHISQIQDASYSYTMQQQGSLFGATLMVGFDHHHIQTSVPVSFVSFELAKDQVAMQFLVTGGLQEFARLSKPAPPTPMVVDEPEAGPSEPSFPLAPESYLTPALHIQLACEHFIGNQQRDRASFQVYEDKQAVGEGAPFVFS